MSKLMRFVD